MKTFFRTVPVLLLTLFLSSCSSGGRSDITVTNNAKEDAAATVVVCGKTFLIELPAGRQTVLQHKIECDSEYEVGVDFTSGKGFSKKLGYVTPQTIWHDEITITGDDITIKQHPEDPTIKINKDYHQ